MSTSAEIRREYRALKKERAAKTFQLRKGFRLKTSAEVVGTFVEELAADLGRPPTTKELLDAARDEACPIHPEFEWDDQAAAELYRLQQARYVVASIIVIERPSNEPPTQYEQRAFVVQEIDDKGTQAIFTREQVFSEEDNYRLFIAHGRHALEQWHKKYGHLTEFQELFLPHTKVLGTRD